MVGKVKQADQQERRVTHGKKVMRNRKKRQLKGKTSS
jgi:hypothetical protein